VDATRKLATSVWVFVVRRHSGAVRALPTITMVVSNIPSPHEARLAGRRLAGTGGTGPENPAELWTAADCGRPPAARLMRYGGGTPYPWGACAAWRRMSWARRTNGTPSISA